MGILKESIKIKNKLYIQSVKILSRVTFSIIKHIAINQIVSYINVKGFTVMNRYVKIKLILAKSWKLKKSLTGKNKTFCQINMPLMVKLNSFNEYYF